MKYILRVLLFCVSCGVATAQVNCNSIVTLDETKAFSDTSSLNRAVAGLVDQGADVHVVSAASVGKYGDGLASVQKLLETNCPSWLVDGHRKPNLFVLMVAPTEHKKSTEQVNLEVKGAV